MKCAWLNKKNIQLFCIRLEWKRYQRIVCYVNNKNRQNISLARLKWEINYGCVIVPSDIKCLCKKLVLSRPEGRANTLPTQTWMA